jgi:co-chaperonin GroES (HSP10)
MQHNFHEASGLCPKGHSILVESYDPDEGTRKIIIPETAKQGMKTAENRARIVAVGELAWTDEPAPRAAVGDKVLLVNYAGVLVMGPKDRKVYRMVNDRDIYCVFDEGETK